MPKRFKTPDPDIVMYADGTFYVRVGDRERSLGTKDFGVATKRKREILDKLDLTGEASGRLRVGSVWPDYLAVRRKQRDLKHETVIQKGKAKRVRKPISAGTYAEIEYVWDKHLSRFWADVRLDKVTDDKWDEYVEFTDVVDLANHRKVFSGLLKWAKRRKYVALIPEMNIPAVERRERHVLKPHEIRALFEHARGNCLLYVSMYLFMGMRRGEIASLRWTDIHLDAMYLVLRKSEVKTRKGRPLPINKFVAELLMARIQDQKASGVKTDFVFPNRKTPKRHASKHGFKTAFRTVCERAGWEPGYITPHDLRATFEAYAHKATAFTDTQREKFAGAAIDVQKKTYVRFDADDVRGLEAVVEVEGLSLILKQRLKTMGKERGDGLESEVH